MTRRAALIIVLLLVNSTAAFGQGVVLIRQARVLVEQIGVREGKSATEEIMALGGESAVRGILQKAATEGGDQLVEKLGRYSLDFGPIILRAAKESPLQFVTAFEQLPANLRTAALGEFRRNPEVMQKLISDYGSAALEAGARHPGVGPAVLGKIGRESSEFLISQPTDRVIRIARLSEGIGKAPPVQRSELLSMIKQAPEKILGILERNPRVLKTGAILAAFLAAKDQILGSTEVVIGPDGRPVVVQKSGLIEKVTGQIFSILEKPLIIMAVVLGLLMTVGAIIYILQSLRLGPCASDFKPVSEQLERSTQLPKSTGARPLNRLRGN